MSSGCDADRPAWQAVASIGVELLRSFESSNDVAQLAEAIDLLTAALAVADGELSPVERYALGVALAYRFGFSADQADVESALRLLEEAFGLSDDQEFRLDVLTDLAELVWTEFGRRAEACGAVVAADWLTTRLTVIPTEPSAPVEQALLDTLAGWARLCRYEDCGEQADLLAGIELIRDCIAWLPADLPVAARNWLELARGYYQLYRHRPAPEWLDRGVEAAMTGRLLAGTTSDQADIAEFVIQEALSRELRWENAGQPARQDLDLAIDCLRLAMAAGQLDLDLRFSLGDLLRQRGELDSSATDLTAAIECLGQTLAAAVDDLELATLSRLDLAAAHRLRGELAGDPADLAAAAVAWSAIAQSGPNDVELESTALRNWVDATGQQLQLAESSGRDGDRRAALAAARQALDWADVAADRIASQDDEQAALLALALIGAHLSLAGAQGDWVDQQRLKELAGRLSALPAEHREAGLAAGDMVAGVGELVADLHGRGGSGYGVAALRQAAIRLSSMDPAINRELAQLLGMVRVIQGQRTGDQVAMAEGRKIVEDTADDDESAQLSAFLEIMATATGLTEDDQPRLRQAVERAVRLHDSVAASDPVLSPMRDWMASLCQLLGIAGPSRAASFSVPADRATADPASVAGLIAEVGTLGRQVGALGHQTGQDYRSAMAALAEQVASSVARLPAAHPMQPQLQAILGIARLELARDGDPAAIADAVRCNERARHALPGPHHLHWATVNLNLAEALRLAGSSAQSSRQASFDGLRGRAWQALLQSGTDEAAAAARGAAAVAARLAGWCVRDGAHLDLVRALEAGRGLVLRAATNDRRVSQRLRAIGAEQLAAEWDGAAGPASDPPGLAWPVGDDLRHRVLLRLQQSDDRDELEPPSVDQIANAIQAQGLSALVYLVPGEDGCPAMAVLVEPGAPVEVIPLPELSTGPGTPLPRYQQAYRAATTAGRAGGSARGAWTAQLRELCDWAWLVAGHLLKQLCAARWPDQVVRLALVPVGALALVPWHAARRWVDDHYQYLVEDLELSVVASAQLLIEVAGRVANQQPGAVIVANPTGDLEYAGIEASAILNSFYPSGLCVGQARTADGHWQRAADGTGSASQLLELIERGAAATTLHLACHGIADQQFPARSRLLLGEHQQLLARDLLQQRRTGLLALDRVFLSACTTHVPGSEYDEAFSLATAFLAAGARTVVGSLWQVSDNQTSALMYMLHHFLAVGLAPIQALVRAQRWMLDPARDVPAGMPDEMFAALFDADLRDPQMWAGFVHLGI